MSVLYNTMFVGVDDDGLVVASYDDKSAEELMEHTYTRCGLTQSPRRDWRGWDEHL